ncbi:MBL fold metallo-hydrolase [Candidatus Woesearchaeota archaeon]|nr:MBL fold metallo-hydrolase [Candidatus Woesearchaeota archaeon]
MKLTIHGGKDEIGGNKILVEHKGTKIFLDFGMSFKQTGMYFSEFLQPRKCAGLADFFELSILPDIQGIYREDYLKHMGRGKETRSVDGVFLSHAHADHAQHIHFLRNDIPIFCTDATKIILETLEETGIGTFSDFVTYCEAFAFYTNKKGELSRVTRKNKEYVCDREFNVMMPGKKVKIGSMEIEMIPVDHSLPGACGFIVYTDEGNLVYTGDIRFHGSHSELSRKFVEKAFSVKPKLLITEGTRINSTKKDSEDGVKKEISEFMSKAKGLVFVEHPVRDLDRLNSILIAANENKRELVVNTKLAYLIEKLGKLSPFSLVKVKIFVPRKSWGLIDKDVEQKLVEGDYETWERDYIYRKNCVTYREIQKHPDKYAVSMNLFNINQLVDINPSSDSIWIKSNCEPFCEEMELDEERKKNWLNHYGIKQHQAHASGHANGEELKEMWKDINAKEVVVVHRDG